MSDREKMMLTRRSTKPYSDEWYTPDALVAALGAFDLDPCAGPKDHAAANIRSHQNGLAMHWHGRVWLNPPYLDLYNWLYRFEKHGHGTALVNARTETKWFQEFCANASAMLLLRSRVSFERPDASVMQIPIGSALIAYGADDAIALRKSCLPGIYSFPRIIVPPKFTRIKELAMVTDHRKKTAPKKLFGPLKRLFIYETYDEARRAFADHRTDGPPWTSAQVRPNLRLEFKGEEFIFISTDAFTSKRFCGCCFNEIVCPEALINNLDERLLRVLLAENGRLVVS